MQILSNLSLYGTLGLNSVADANTDTDKFLVIDSSGIVKYRTGAELYNDIGAGGAAAYTSVLQHTVKAGVALTKGQAVYVTSADGTNMIVGKASNASEATSSKTLGLIVQDLAINDQGFVVTEGLLAGLDTSTANAGDPVWLGTDGSLIYGLLNKPYAPNHLVFIGIVTRAQQNNGEIFVKVQNGFELQELHNVQITSTPSDNAVLAYETSTSLYKMKSIPTLLGYTPVTNARSITINGTTYDLSADRSWSVGTHTGNLTTGYVPKATGATTLTDSLIYDNGSGIGINTSSPYESSAFKLDVNGGLLIKNTSGTTAQLILINSNPATGGNNGFVQLSAGGNTDTTFGQWQTYYGMSVAAGALRLQPAGGQVLIGTTTTSAFLTDINGTLRVSGQLTLGSTISNNTYVYTMPGASGTLALVSQIPSLSGYLTIASADATYLTQSSAASIYLSQTSASNTYLTISGASSTYLSQANASNTYLTISGASSIYLSQTSASNTYLSINSASSIYLSQTSASNTYLTINNAASTYVSLTGSYANPSWITSLAWSKITGAPAFLTSYTETDTLATVTARGATTTGSITINGTVTLATDISMTRSDTPPAIVFTNQNGLRWVYSGGGNYWSTTLSIDSNNLINMAGSPLATRSWVTSQGYITGYTETDTLATVTARGASTTTRTTFTEVGATRAGSDTVAVGPWFRWTNVAEDRQMLVQLNASNGLTYWSYNGSAWATALVLTQAGAATFSSSITTTGASIGRVVMDYDGTDSWFRMQSGNRMRITTTGGTDFIIPNTGNMTYNGNTVWHSGNLTNLNQLSNGPGYITGESDTLSSVISRGNTTGGNIITSANMYASVFYDYANNGYYLDPNSTSYLYSVRAVNDVTTEGGQGRFGGWYTGTGYTGAAVEVGFSGGNGNVISYNRISSAYQPLYISGSNLYLQQQSGLVYINSALVRQGAGQGWLSGNYGTAESTATSGAIYSIGGSYVPTSSSLNNMYGIGYTYGAVAGLGASTAWGLYVVAGQGSAKVFLDADNGVGTATGSWRAPVFYDSANTSYYGDFDSTSRMYQINVNYIHSQYTSITGPRWDTSFYVLQSQHWYAHSSTQDMYLGESNVINVRNTAIAVESFRAPIFYDSQDTTYFLDPNSTSLLSYLRVVNQFYVGNGSQININYDQIWRPDGGQIHIGYSAANNIQLNNGGGYTYSLTSLRAPIFYDYNDTGYYGDFAGTSRLNVLNIVDYQYIGGQTVNGQSHYQWEGATYRNPGGYTAGLIVRRDNATTGLDGSYPALVLYNNNGGDQTTVAMSFATMESASGGNAVPLGGIIAKKSIAGNNGGWSSGSLTFYVKDLGTRRDALTMSTNGNLSTSYTMYAAAFRGNANVSGTGEAVYAPAGIYSTGTNWLYGTMYLNVNSINDTADIRTYNSSYSFRARYTAGSDVYHSSLNWYGLQLGNNGGNYIIAGRTNPGGKLYFYTNNTSDFTSINGTFAAAMHATGRTSFGSDSDNGYQVQVYGSFYSSDWIRVAGSSGLYFESYGGGWHMNDSTWIRSYNSKNVYMSADVRTGGQFQLENGSSYWARYGTYSGSLHRIAYISFDWDSNYNAYANNGIASTDSNGNFSDCMSVNSYNDITLRLDSNDNNDNSYLRISNNTTGSGTIAWIGYESGMNQNYFSGSVGISAGPRTDGYRLNMGGSIHLNGSSVDYVGSLYFSGAGHIQPNAGSYGSLQMTNAKNGWAGIRFTESEVNLMMNTNESGHYRNGYGWQFRWYNGAMYISTGANGGGTEYVALHTGGATLTNVFYYRSDRNTDSSNAPLQAYSGNGGGATMAFHRGGYYAVNFGLDSDNVMRIGGWSASTNRWQLDMSGNMTVAGDVTAYSDARVKENVITVDNALSKVLSLRGVYYNRTDSEDKNRKIGVIAQETMTIIPEVVNQDNAGMYNVSYGNLGGLFIEAFKEQQKKIEAQDRVIEDLKSKLDAVTK